MASLLEVIKVKIDDPYFNFKSYENSEKLLFTNIDNFSCDIRTKKIILRTIEKQNRS